MPKESDSATFENQVLIGASKAVTSRIAIYEARATFQRKEAEGIIQPGAASNSTVILVELGADVERECGQVLTLCYKRSPPVPLRTLDALHLACARVAAESEIIATDKRMRDAATVLGFSLFPA